MELQVEFEELESSCSCKSTWILLTTNVEVLYVDHEDVNPKKKGEA